MAQLPSRFTEIAQQLKENKQPRRATVRKVLRWFNAQRRGASVVAEIESALSFAGLETDPPFADVGMDELLRFVLRSARPTEDTRLGEPKGEEAEGSAAAAIETRDVTDNTTNYLGAEEVATSDERDSGPRRSSAGTTTWSDGAPFAPQIDSSDQPIVGGQTTAQNEAVEQVLKRLEEGEIFVPSYQRDSDEWDDVKKSLFIESILNRLTVPAFYLAPAINDPDRFEIVDGQQRLTTLADFFGGKKYRLMSDDDCPYFGSSVHYADKNYWEIHESWQKAFRRYNLTLVTLPQGMPLNLRLEIFRRINEGGTPLSGQDIRLSYYGESAAVRYIQLVGIYDADRTGAKRMLTSGPSISGWPWATDLNAAEAWRRWWINTKTVTGQTSSEMFTWFIVAKTRSAIDAILQNKNHLMKNLKLAFRNSTDEVLDIVCAELKYEDENPSAPRVLPDVTTLANEYFAEFQTWWYAMRMKCATQVQVGRHRAVAL